MGHMDVLSIISDGFNIYFPMIMLAICLATWFSLGSRTLNAFGFQQFMLNEMISSEIVQEGKDLMAREKRRRQRAEEALHRRRPNDISRELTNVSHTKYRSTRNTSPGDGLLRDSDTVDYSTTQRELDFNRSLTDEINERFGVSTQVSVGFKGYNYNDEDESDLESMGRRPHNTSIPPRGLFDDV